MFGHLLGCYTMYTFSGLLPLTEFCQLQNSLCIHVLCSPILAALLHGTRAVAVSQTVWRGTRNRITELSQRAPSIFGWAATTLGIGPHSSLNVFTSLVCPSVGPMSIIQADIVPKWLKVGSYKQYHTRDSGFLKPRISRIFEGITQSGGAKCRCMGVG